MAANTRRGTTGTSDFRKQELMFVHHLKLSAQDALTANAGGGQANGVTLADYSLNKFSTVASAADSATLPKAKQGDIRIVKNGAAANSMNIFPASGEAINAIAADGAYALAVTKTVIFICFTDGLWDTILTA